MNYSKLTSLAAAVATCFTVSGLAVAQEEPVDVETEVGVEVEAEAGVDINFAADTIANDFSDFLGDSSGVLVGALRNGDSLSFTNEQGEIISVDNTAGPMGYGEVSITLGLAETLAGEDISPENIANVLQNTEGSGILDLRSEGMGWGQIFDTYGTTVGAVMSRLNANEAAQARLTLARTSSENRAAGSELRGDFQGAGSDRPDRGEFSGRPDRVERPEIAARLERPVRPERPNLPSRPTRP